MYDNQDSIITLNLYFLLGEGLSASIPILLRLSRDKRQLNYQMEKYALETQGSNLFGQIYVL